MGNRFMRCVAKYIQWRAVAIREPEDAMAAALASYWEKEARKEGIKMDEEDVPTDNPDIDSTPDTIGPERL